MGKYGFFWKVRFYRKHGFWPGERQIRFLEWLDLHRLLRKFEETK